MMLQLLIVDDEPLAANYLAETLLELPELPFNITIAYSGNEALQKLGEDKVDILLTDIRMQGMNGLELADRILARWPLCRVIFLSGYNDFEYVQTALRKGGVDYVLKTEGDDVILRALEKAVVDIAAEINDKEILQKARQQVRLALPSLQRDYLLELLQGQMENAAARKRRFAELEIDLDPEQPVYVILGKIDNWGPFAAPGDKVLLFYSIHNIGEEYLKSESRIVLFQLDRTRSLWLVQPRTDGLTAHLLASYAERIQAACKGMLKIPLSLAVSSTAVGWEHIGSRMENLKLQLTFRLGSGEEMLITEDESEPSGQVRLSSAMMAEAGRLRSNVHKLDLLEACLDNGQLESFADLYRQLFRTEEELFSNEEGKWLSAELFAHLSAFFLTYMNKRKLFTVLEPGIPIEKMFNPDQHSDMKAMMAFFETLGERVAAYNCSQQKERSHSIIDRVHRYIHQFLHEELSLTKLAELVYLSPPYLSRMYKHVTGQGLLEYINETRIQKGRMLLQTTDKKIQDIAVEIGFESATYFIRLFRKKTGKTPQEYRDSTRGMEPL